MLEKKLRSKVSYTVMIISDSAKKDNREYHIKAGAVGAVTGSVFLFVVILVCYVVYSSIILSDAYERSRSQLEQITQLSEKNQTLESEKAVLSDQMQDLESQVAALSATVHQKMEEEQLLAAAEEDARFPRGFPLSGAAQLRETEGEADNGEGAASEMQAKEEQKEVIFLVEPGVNVTAAGTGTVIAVDQDMEYGNLVKIDHGNGYISFYRNDASPVVKVGNEVEKGALLYVIGEGNTELGYSISRDGVYIDPLEMIEING